MADVMKTTAARPDRDAKIDARCSSDLRKKLERIAALKEADLSDIVREALRTYAAKFDQLAA